MTDSHARRGRLLALSLGALGVVYGDIGTSPLYALRECFHGSHAIEPTPHNVLGVLSLILWSLILVVSLKYVVLVMRADNRGEGGILSLMALIRPEGSTRPGATAPALAALGVFGAALLYGDGMITPAISVLSAVEGLEIATPVFRHFIVPITVGILIALFAIQKRGTARIGAVFGPVMLVWFAALTFLGVGGILREPRALASIHPLWALRFFAENELHGFIVLGSVFLVVTGGEALYADMGHFGKRPIRFAWFAVAFPALVLEYLGQGALLLQDPSARTNPFYLLAPEWARLPLVALSTAAAIIASQALISGAFSLTQQAAQLGYFPRVEIRHTSDRHYGQIYIPQINMLLLVSSVALVLAFRSSSNLAAAYGVAVTGVMLITTLLIWVVMRHLWGWSWWLAGGIAGFFLLVDLAFFVANLTKVFHGGWVPLAMGIVGFTVMSTWRKGRRILADRTREASLSLGPLLAKFAQERPTRVPGTAIFMSGDPQGVPPMLLHNVRHNKVLHQRIVLLTLLVERVPRVPREERVTITPLADDFYRVVARYGFMEEPSVPEVLDLCREKDLDIDVEDTTFFLSKESLLATDRPGMALWRERLFAVMHRNAVRATAAFDIPPSRVVELGSQIEL